MILQPDKTHNRDLRHISNYGNNVIFNGSRMFIPPCFASYCPERQNKPDPSLIVNLTMHRHASTMKQNSLKHNRRILVLRPKRLIPGEGRKRLEKTQHQPRLRLGFRAELGNRALELEH